MQHTTASLLAVRVDYQSIFGDYPTRERFLASLRDLPLQATLDLVGRASAVLFNALNANHPSVQRTLCTAFFPTSNDEVWKQFWRSSGALPNPVLFDESSLLFLAKMVLSASDANKESTQLVTDDLGRLALMANTYINEEQKAQLKEGANDIRSWSYLSFVATSSQSHENILHSAARSFDLFLTDRDHLRHSSNYFCFPEIIERSTGLKPIEFWAIMFSLLTHFKSIDLQSAPSTPSFVSMEHYFEAFSFTQDQVERIFALIGDHRETVRERIACRVNANSLQAYENTEISKTPLILIGQRAFCPSLRCLLQGMTGGLYHALLKSIDGAQRNRYFEFVGEVFESYTDALIRRVTSSNNNSHLIYLGPNELKLAAYAVSRKSPPKLCDHAIWDGSNLIIWDSKARFLPSAVRSGSAFSDYVERFGSLFVKAARQLDSTAKLAISGGLQSAGIDGRDISRVIPAIVSLADYAVQPPTNEWIRRSVKELELLTDSRCLDIELLMSQDIEAVESIWTSGADLGSLFIAKANSENWKYHSFHNYLALADEALDWVSHSPHLKVTFDRLASDAEKLLRSFSTQEGTVSQM